MNNTIRAYITRNMELDAQPPTPTLAEQILIAMDEQVAAYNALCKAQRRTHKAQAAEAEAQRDAKIADARMAALAMQYQAAHDDDGELPY